MENIIVGEKAIKSAITSIKTRGTRLDSDIQNAALAVINHVELHGDVTLVNTLIAAMPKGSRINALLAWLENFGKVRWNKKKKCMVYDGKKNTDIAGGQAKSWLEFKPEPEYNGWDDKAQLIALVKRMKAARDAEKSEEDEKKDKLDDALFAKLQELAA